MKKGVKIVLFVAFLALIILLAGCGKKECKDNSDCARPGFSSTCVDDTCIRIPIPGACGNDDCETDTGENECTCASDCGICAGAIPGSTLLQKTCINDDTICTVDVPSNKVKPVSITNTINSQGNTFKVTSIFNQPFNFKKDGFKTTVLLDNVARFVSNIRITGYELTGTTSDRRTVVLADESVNKPIPAIGVAVEDELRLDLVTGDLEGTITDPKLTIDYEYTVTSGTSSQLRTAQMLNLLRGVTFTWVKPAIDYGCPLDCNDNNPGTADSCGPETNFFCEYSPISGACGNFQCDGGENKCTCPSDCGPCSGSAGQYMSLGCDENNCVASVRSGISTTPVSVFDDRKLGPFHLNNRFVYNKPFNAVDDTISVEFTLFNIRDGVSNVKIDSVRALESSRELGFLNLNRELTSVGTSVSGDVSMTFVGRPEAEHFVTLTVAYSYVENGQVRKATFTKALERITFYTPGTI